MTFRLTSVAVALGIVSALPLLTAAQNQTAPASASATPPPLTADVHIGAKLAEAEKNDLIPTIVSQPEGTVWLVQPQQALPDGEYALMAGTQNMSIFPFTVAAATPSSAASQKY